VAAARAVRSGGSGPVTVPWLIGVARHKLVDPWRRLAQEECPLSSIEAEAEANEDDLWDRHLDEARAIEVLRTLGPHHRAALTLRYVDDLPVREVAATLDRTERATEALLVRARRAFRHAYEQGGDNAA
jgi:RNA polymerase sigma-70 factor (ECF subfamily)